MLRIISGRIKGKRLSSPKGMEIRPTPIRLKRRMFDILSYKIIGSNFLDGFAGTGAVGIEAYSLGASLIYFIEKEREAVKILEKNIKRIGNPTEVHIINDEFNMGVKELQEKRTLFDFIFIDPPYRFLDYANPFKILYKKNILKEDGVIILQKECKLKIKKPFFQLFRKIREGKNCLLFFRREQW